MLKNKNRSIRRKLACILAIFLVVESFVTVPKVQVQGEEQNKSHTYQTIYTKEAGDAELTNGASVKLVEDKATGKQVTIVGVGTDHVADRPNGTCSFTDVTVPTTGEYWLNLYYCADNGDRYFDLYVNDEYHKVQCPASGDWYTMGKYQISVELREGVNELSFSCADWYAPNLHKIEVVDKSITIEAEDGVLTDGASTYEVDLQNGGKATIVGVGTDHVENRPNGMVTFNEIMVDEEGVYGLDLYYCADNGDRYFDMTVNGEYYKVQCPASGPWYTIGSYGVKVNLQKGSNILTFSCADWYAPNMDKIVLTKLTEEETPVLDLNRTVVEAEDMTLTNGASADSNSESCSSGVKVSNLGGVSDGSALCDLTVDQAGTYGLVLSYCTASAREFEVTINGKTRTITCNSSKDWSIPNDLVLVVDLNAGQNHIVIHNSHGNAPNLDKIELFPARAVLTSNMQLIYDMENGVYSITQNGRTIVEDAFAKVKLNDTEYTSNQYTARSFHQSKIKDAFGKGIRFTVTNTADGLTTMIQEFDLYENLDYLLTKVTMDAGKNSIGTNWISPLTTSMKGSVENCINGSNYVIRVPYDNDSWITYDLQNINGSGESYEVTAILDQAGRSGLVIGSITHDTWKTGISYTGSSQQINQLSVYGGANSNITRDKSPHGTVSGSTVTSPTIMVGEFADWEEGLDAFGEANTKIVPKKIAYTDKVPFGWNSWGAIQTDINLDNATAISDYVHDNLQEAWTTDENDVVYINLDSYWDNMTDAQLNEFVDHCKANGQKAGIYWTPFVAWHAPSQIYTSYVENTNKKYTIADIILRKENGEMYDNSLAGAYPVDVTHPGTKARINYFIDRFKAAGFEYIKLDFMTHGSLEGKHYDTTIQTGIQAYNQAMKYILDRIDGTMFVNLSIAPTFPYQYADGKRIACDAYYQISDTEYTLNSLTYGFWQKKLYNYPDPDNLIVWGKDGNASIEEARSRVLSGVLLGTSFITGDNFANPITDTEESNLRFKTILTNPLIIQTAKIGKIFHPVQVNPSDRAATQFVMQDKGTIYMAILNYDVTSKEYNIDLTPYLNSGTKYTMKTAYTNITSDVAADGKLTISLAGKNSELIQITPVSNSEGNNNQGGNEQGENQQ